MSNSNHNINTDIAGRLDEVARLLEEQGAQRFRVQAYRHAAESLRSLGRPVSDLFAEKGVAGLETLPGVGTGIARSIRDILLHGKLDCDPVALLTSVPGIGKSLAWRLHDDFGIETLEALEAAAHDGRLETLAGLGPKRLAGIRDSLAHRLGRVRSPVRASEPSADAPVAELLEVDSEYRQGVAAGRLRKIAPRRLNPAHESWLPVLHTHRREREYTALFSNTPRAHQLHKTGDWVVLYCDGGSNERQFTVITSRQGPLAGRRIVRGREAECLDYYKALGELATPEQTSTTQAGLEKDHEFKEIEQAGHDVANGCNACDPTLIQP
jgi:DNA polymerase (family X)